MRNFATLLIGLLLLSGCVTTPPKVWSKPGSSQDEFSKDRYTCLQQAQQPVSGAYVNQYGGSSSGQMITNDNLFGACMNANGWYLTPANQPTIAPQQ